jgi:phosphoribosyl 1,2-cyclic phosphodiesterase
MDKGLKTENRKPKTDMRFTMLASGSSGNACLVQSAGFGVLIDVGLGPRQVGSRLAQVGLSWSAVQAVLLTHTHGDHWKEATLLHLHRYKVPLWCHAGHHTVLRTYSDGFLALHAAGLVRSFEANEAFELSPQLRCRALPLRHDGGATFGFRLEGFPPSIPPGTGGDRGGGQSGVIGYVADLGCWDEELAAWLVDVDILAVEFNHDVAMQQASGRTPQLIQRVLGEEGHLSNVQAAALVRAVLERSTAGRLRHLVQLHLSRECNWPALASSAAQRLLEELGVSIGLHTAEQSAASATLHLNAAVSSAAAQRSSKPRTRSESPIQPMLPGLDGA